MLEEPDTPVLAPPGWLSVGSTCLSILRSLNRAFPEREQPKERSFGHNRRPILGSYQCTHPFILKLPCGGRLTLAREVGLQKIINAIISSTHAALADRPVSPRYISGFAFLYFRFLSSLP